MNRTLRNIILLSLVAISLAMHFKGFSKDLMSIHVWRQTQTQSNIINFYEEDMNILNPRRNVRGDSDGVFRMEFPLMQWLVACGYKIFGNHLVITRIFMFIIGLATVLGMYNLLYALFNNRTLSIIGAWAFNFSPSFYYYTINPMPDNLALCCAIWGIALFFFWHKNNKQRILILSGLLLSIGTLCKLPFIAFYAIPLLYFIKRVQKGGLDKRIIRQLLSAFGCALFPIIWYVTVIPTWKNNAVIKGILDNEDTALRILDYLHHNLISTLPELLLNYGSVVFFLAGFYFLFRKKSFLDSRFMLLLSLSVTLILYYLFEINAIAKIHDYYLFPFYPLLFILVAYGAYNLLISGSSILRYLTLVILLFLPVICYLRMQGRLNPDSPGFNKDLLIYKTELQNAVPKSSLVVAGNDESSSILFYYVDKKGWAFQNDELSSQKFQIFINKGAKYLYSDSRKIDTNPEIMRFFDQLILEKGTIKIYSLKN